MQSTKPICRTMTASKNDYRQVLPRPRRFLRATALYAMARIMLSPARLSVRLSVRPSDGCIIEQESCAIAKMTARCAL